MKLDIPKEWCLRMAELEGDAEIGAGRMALVMDRMMRGQLDCDPEEVVAEVAEFLGQKRSRRPARRDAARSGSVSRP